MSALLWLLFFLVIAISVVVAGIYGYWWLASLYRIRKSRKRPLFAHLQTLWRDPGKIEELDLYYGPGGPTGVPAPPFRFIKEHSSGSNPCLSVQDAKGRTWRVKWGDEVQSETFASRLVWATGYHSEVTHFLPEGRIEGITGLDRARECVGEDCSFKNARFELDDKEVRKRFDEHGWAWNENPFVGTRELNGLKIMLMLLSNWDNKDVRDVARGSNTAIFQVKHPDGTFEAQYLIIDWGASMGKWGSVGFREKWNLAAYEAQNDAFIKGVDNGVIKWGYVGQRTEDAVDGITVEDVKWLCQYLGRITDEQIGQALRASGATDEERARFTTALRHRINQLLQIAEFQSLTGGLA